MKRILLTTFFLLVFGLTTSYAAVESAGSISGKLVSFNKENVILKIKNKEYKFKKSMAENNKDLVVGQIVKLNLSWDEYLEAFHKGTK